MEICIFTIGRRTTRKRPAIEELFATYTDRISHYGRVQAENFLTEAKFWAAIERYRGRSNLALVLLDSRGRAFTTEEFALWLQAKRDQSAQRIIFAIGPADGWSAEARKHAEMLLSLGPMTLPHELAAVVMAEQIYRAFTIIEGHPYHLGHT